MAENKFTFSRQINCLYPKTKPQIYMFLDFDLFL